MEHPLFSDEIFKRNVQDANDEVDLLNNETFGLHEDISVLNGDWERHHKELSKVIELEHERVIPRSSRERLRTLTSSSFESHEEIPTSEDEEEDIIENTISQLGLDDDFQFVVKSTVKSPSIEFKESQQSWTSPSRGQRQQSDSLKELISPGEGVWASPSRKQLIGEYLSPNTRNKDYDQELINHMLFGQENEFSSNNIPPLPVFNNNTSPLAGFKTNEASPLSAFKINDKSPLSGLTTNVSPLSSFKTNFKSTESSPISTFKTNDESSLSTFKSNEPSLFPPLPSFDSDESHLPFFNSASPNFDSTDVSSFTSDHHSLPSFDRNESPVSLRNPALSNFDSTDSTSFSCDIYSPLPAFGSCDVSPLPAFRSNNVSPLSTFRSNDESPLSAFKSTVSSSPAFKNDDASRNLIHVEDLERGLTNGNGCEPNKWDEHLGIKKHAYPCVSGPSSSQADSLPSPQFPLQNHKNVNQDNQMHSANQLRYDMNNLASMVMMNPHLIGLRGCRPMLNSAFPPLMQPNYLLDPSLFTNPSRATPKWQNSRHRKHHDRNSISHQDKFAQDNYWSKGWQEPDSDEIDYDQLIQLGPSKMMTSKEKKWIFKISLMSLLSGDPDNSDYYFRSFLMKKYLREKEMEASKEAHKSFETTNQLMLYAQKQQQTKESHKPVKFKGSLGKLSITSVHHPRQLMDFTSSEQELKVQEGGGKKKFLFYGIVEKMYSILLQILDMDREFANNPSEEHDELLCSRVEKINELFDLFKVAGHDTQTPSCAGYFGNLMSISKGRKLLSRVILLLNQEQRESLLVAVINVLPALLKKDKELSLLSFVEKVQIVLNESHQKFKLKCVQLIRKIDLIVLLSYPTSIMVLSALLDSWEEKNPRNSLEWSYYIDEIPNVLSSLPEDVSLKNKPHLELLQSILRNGERLIDV